MRARLLEIAEATEKTPPLLPTSIHLLTSVEPKIIDIYT